MSFLFKAVLGQRVVHPPPLGSDKGTHAAANNVQDTKLSGAPAAMAASPSVAINGDHGNSSTIKSSYGGAASPSSRDGPSANPLTSSPSPRPSTSTRTLLLRIEGCAVAQDIRDAQCDLLRSADLPYALDATALKSLLDLLVSYAEDESITEPTLHLLANATNLDLYPDQMESNHRVVEVTAALKRRARDALLAPLIDAVGLLLDSMKTTAPFWSRYYVVVLLQRLEEFEPYKLNQALLGARGIGVLLDALNETQQDHLLRNQALQLLTSLTLTDAELQTLLAFHNAFDSLFDVIQREGGARRGRSIVKDCLTVVHNMLRSNKATQKFFREMGCAARLVALFDSVPSQLAACTVVDHGHNGAANSSPCLVCPPLTVLTAKLEEFLDVTKKPDTMLNVLMSASILACVLRGIDEDEEELKSIQDALLRCGLLTPLARLAFSGLAIDDATRIETVRVLALLLNGSKRGVEEWLNLPPVTILVRATLPYRAQVWPAPRALLSCICETTDTTLVSAGVQLFTVVLGVPVHQERSVGVFLSGLVSPTSEYGDDPSGGVSVQASSTTSPLRTVKGTNASTSDEDAQCGVALARVLLSSRTSAVEKFYAAQVLRALVALPGATQVAQSLVHSPVPPHLQKSTLDDLVKTQPGWTLSSRLPPSFFNYTVTFLIFCLSGGAVTQQMNTAALGAYSGALLAWMSSSPLAATAFVEEVSWSEALLDQARRDGPAHLRLWSAVVIASACVVSKKAAAAGAAPPTAAAAAAALMHRFTQVVGGGAVLDTILFDMQASTPVWQHPVASGLRTQDPTPYDEATVALVEQLVAEFKQLLDSVARSASHGPAAMMRLPPSTHSEQLHPGHALPERGVASHPVAPPPTQAGQLPLKQPPSELAAASLGSLGHSPMSSTDFLVEPPPPDLPVVPLRQEVIPPVSDARTHEMLAALQGELEATRAEKADLMHALEEWRERAEQLAAQYAILENEQQRRVAAAAEEGHIQVEDAAASAMEDMHSQAACADMVDGLRENIRLLEEALNSKEEEHQQLVESMNMMEEQLRHASDAATSQRQELLQQRQQHQGQRHLPPLDVITKMEAERNAVAQQLALSQEETARLQQTLKSVSKDYSELLLLVAELNEECMSVRAGSSMAPTPVRPWPENAGLSLKREVGVPQDPPVYNTIMSDEGFFASAEMLPVKAAAPQCVGWEGTVDSMAIGTCKAQGREPASTPQALHPVLAAERQTSGGADWTHGASVHASDAPPDVSIDQPDTRTLAHADAASSLTQQLFVLPAAPAAPFPALNSPALPTEAASPSPHPLPQLGGQQQPHVGQPLLPPGSHASPPPPPPATAPHQAVYQSALQVPRYTDPSITVLGECGASGGAGPQQHSVVSTDVEYCSPQLTALSHPPPLLGLQHAVLAYESPQNADPAEIYHEVELADCTVHHSTKGVLLSASQSIQETAARDTTSAVEGNAPSISASYHSAQLSGEDAPPVAVIAANSTVLNSPLAGTGSAVDNLVGMDSGEGALCRSGANFGMGVGETGNRNAGRWATRELFSVTNAFAQPPAAAALNGSAASTSEAFCPGVRETESFEDNKRISGPTTTYNPFADLNTSDDDAEAGFRDLR
uniref:Vesicle tethering protein Uso1/P115-like head domain-containing protein n=1 Tax=Leishmania shawi TaxID=5680 RepID=A0AAW3BAY3_9TRYP